MHHKDVFQAHTVMILCVCVAGEEAWAVMNKQALFWLCGSVEPTKWEQISQDSPASIRGFSQFLLLSRLSCSHLMSSGAEILWHFCFNKNRHTQIHTCVNVTSNNRTFLTFSVVQYRLTCFVNLVDLFEHSFVPILRSIHRLRKEK